MKSRFLPIALASLLVACQTHLPAVNPELPTSIHPPRSTDVIDHIQCELAEIVNAPAENGQMKKRMAADSRLQGLLPNLLQYNFVATAQIALEVTDMEGLTPSLTFMNAAMTHMVGVGGQWNGTQDRSVTVNYSIDLAHLIDPKDPSYWRRFCTNKTMSGGITGDIGLADIVADGLIALSESADYNVYGGTGPSPAAVAKLFNQIGSITAPASGNLTALNIKIDSLAGSILLAPQSAGSQTQGTVSLTGVATLENVKGEPAKYIANWTGSIVPPDSIGGGHLLYFSLSGALLPEPDQPLAKQTTQWWGFSPTLNLTGTINDALQVNSLQLAGVLVPAAGSDYAKAGAPVITVSLPENSPPHAALGASASNVKGGSPGSASSSGGTSFGSLVDFVLVYGLNGSPSYSFQNVKGLSAMGTPFLNVMRTHTDSVAITFVATCQSPDKISQFIPKNYWQSIGPCDQFGVAQDQARSFGYQNNSLMFLRNVFVRP